VHVFVEIPLQQLPRRLAALRVITDLQEGLGDV